MRRRAPRSQRTGFLDGEELAKVFAWLRPNDLVWNYWVNNYLLGETPPAFDILCWNADTTSLPAGLHSDFLDLFASNGLAEGTLTVLGTPVDLGRSTSTPTSSPGRPTTSSRGRRLPHDAVARRRVRVRASSSGHIQAMVNPPGNPKASYLTADGHRRPTPTSGCERAESTPARGGTTGSSGSPKRSGGSARRRRPRQRRTRRSSPHPAATCT